MNPIILDPGHGGCASTDASSSRGLIGPTGARESDLTLDIAVRTHDALARLGQAVSSTRAGEENPTLAERRSIALAQRPAAIVSLHLNAHPPGGNGCEVWVHDGAEPTALALAESILANLSRVTGAAAPGVLEGALEVLRPESNRREPPACLVEICDMTDAERARQLEDTGFREAIAQAIARGISEALSLEVGPSDSRLQYRSLRQHFDIWHEVPLVHQLTGMSCWAAAAAMLVGWRDCVPIDPEQVARGAGRWQAYRDGLTPEDVYTLAHAWSLVVEPPRRYNVGDLRELLEQFGPLWVGEASPGLHVVVIAGMSGDGTPEGTRLRIADPWPIGKGERYSITFSEWAQRLEAASELSGGQAQVLHSGGRGGAVRGASDSPMDLFKRRGHDEPTQ